MVAIVKVKQFAVAIAIIASTVSANASGVLKQGVSEISGSKFNYSIVDLGSGQRRIEVIHAADKYDGPLAEMAFRDRHLQVFGLVAGLIKDSCQNGVSSLGNINISRDPEQDEDPGAEHPRFFTWEYSCK